MPSSLLMYNRYATKRLVSDKVRMSKNYRVVIVRVKENSNLVNDNLFRSVLEIGFILFKL